MLPDEEEEEEEEGDEGDAGNIPLHVDAPCLFIYVLYGPLITSTTGFISTRTPPHPTSARLQCGSIGMGFLPLACVHYQRANAAVKLLSSIALHYGRHFWIPTARHASVDCDVKGVLVVVGNQGGGVGDIRQKEREAAIAIAIPCVG